MGCGPLGSPAGSQRLRRARRNEWGVTPSKGREGCLVFTALRQLDVTSVAPPAG